MKIQFGEALQKCAAHRGGKAAAAFLCQLALSGLAFNAVAEPSVYPTGVTRSAMCSSRGADKITRLIDLNGNVVHDWKHEGFPSVALDSALIGGNRGQSS